jgi:hypothetical protein
MYESVPLLAWYGSIMSGSGTKLSVTSSNFLSSFFAQGSRVPLLDKNYG